MPEIKAPEKVLKKDVVINLAVLVTTLGCMYLALKVWGPDEMRAFVESAGPLAPLALIAAKTSTIVFAPLSGAFLYPLAGTLFGFKQGLALAVLGDAIGGSIAFWISRLWGRRLVEKMLGGEAGILSTILGTIGTVRGFLFTRIILITAQDIIAYAAGLTKLPYIPFIVIHISVSLVPTTILTGLGSTLSESQTSASLGILFGGMSAVGAISLLAFMYYTNRQLAASNAQPPASESQEQNDKTPQ